MIVNGKVYVGTQTGVAVFGLLHRVKERLANSFSLVSELGSQNQEISEYPCFENGLSAAMLLQLRYGAMEKSVGLHHLGNGWAILAPDKCVAKFTHDAFRCAFMNVAVRSIQIAKLISGLDGSVSRKRTRCVFVD